MRVENSVDIKFSSCPHAENSIDICSPSCPHAENSIDISSPSCPHAENSEISGELEAENSGITRLLSSLAFHMRLS